MFKKNNVGKRILSAVITAAIAFPILVGGASNNMSKVQAATMPGNPRTGADGVTTWDCVWFGRYPQSSEKIENKDPIKWRVLSVNGNDAFLVADCNLDTKRYNEKQNVDVSWEVSTIRSWLNGYSGNYNLSGYDYSTKRNFINTAFGVTEQKSIMFSTIDNPGNEYYQGAAGNLTQDRIFLLSYKDVTNPAFGFAPVREGEPIEKAVPPTKYISVDDPAKVRKNTVYVAAGGSGDYSGDRSEDQNDAGQAGYWWLRTNGNNGRHVAYVGSTGSVVVNGSWTDYNFYSVCPALHLDLTNTAVWSFAGTVNTKGEITPGEAAPVVDDEIKKNPDEAYVINDKDNTAVYKPTQEASATEYVVPDTVVMDGVTYTVTSIADGAFKNNKNIKSITIGKNVETIGKDAFKGCTALKTVVIANNVTTIGENAFMGCSSLENVTIGARVTTIKARAFYKCTRLKKIIIPSAVKSIGKEAFFGCKKLKNITIKTAKLTNKNVGSKAFKGIHSKATIKVIESKLRAYNALLRSKGVGKKAKFKK